MAGSKSTVTGEDFYGAYDAQNFAAEHGPELGMQTVPSLNIAYTEERGYVTADVAEKEGLHTLKLSGEGLLFLVIFPVLCLKYVCHRLC